jgi:hypothetical protein
MYRYRHLKLKGAGILDIRYKFNVINLSFKFHGMHHSFQMLYSSSYNKNNTTLADRLLVPDGIIRPVVVSSVSELTCIFRYSVKPA